MRYFRMLYAPASVIARNGQAIKKQWMCWLIMAGLAACKSGPEINGETEKKDAAEAMLAYRKCAFEYAVAHPHSGLSGTKLAQAALSACSDREPSIEKHLWLLYMNGDDMPQDKRTVDAFVGTQMAKLKADARDDVLRGVAEARIPLE